MVEGAGGTTEPPKRRKHLQYQLLPFQLYHIQGGKQTKKAYAYSIKVTKSWNHTEEVYEDVFDSYTMDLNTFKGQLQARLSEYNENEEGTVYYIGSDAKTTTRLRMKRN